MKKIKLITAIIAAAAIALSFSACGNNSSKASDKTVKIGVVGESQEMWVPVTESLKKQGINVELVKFTDYNTPNAALNNGEIDLNAFQHYAFLNNEIKNHNYDITSIGDTFISAMNIYSNKIKDVSEIKKNDKVAVPNDATNEGRAIKVLASAGLIKTNPAAGDSPEVKDITDNPLNLQLVEVDAANVCALLPDVTIAVVNCNYALDNGLNPDKDSIFKDSIKAYSGNSYFNLIAAKTSEKDNETYKKIVKAYQCEAVEQVYKDTYKGSYLPAWKQ